MALLRFTPGSQLDAALARVFHAYRAGIRKRPEPDFVPRSLGFDALVFLGTLGWMGIEERLRLRKLHVACSSGLALARAGKLETARDRYREAGAELERLKEGRGPARLLAISSYEAGVAYLEFRRGSEEQARRRLDLAMDADLELEELGLPAMQMHRVQQGHNLVRIEVRNRRLEEGVRLSGQLLAYLERRAPGLPYHRAWRPRRLLAVPRGLVRAMIHQIVGEAAGAIVAGGSRPDLWRLLLDECRPEGDPEVSVFPQAGLALRAQADRLAFDGGGYLRHLELFFEPGIKRCHLLWYPMLVDLADFCGQLGSRQAEQVREVLLRDSVKWKGFPPFLRDRLRAARPEQRTSA